MVALAAANVTVTVGTRRIHQKIAHNQVTIAFGDGALTYPAGGVPMPAYQSFGFKRFLESLQLVDPGSANGFLYKYDKTNNKLRIYQGDNTNAAAAPAVELGGSAAPAATSIQAVAVGW